MADLDAKLRGALEPLLETGEELRGVCVATQQSMFKGRQVAIGIAGRRLIVQGMNRRFAPDGEPISLPPERIAEASVDGAGGDWMEVGAAILDQAAITLKLRTGDGEKLKLTMMRGDGPLGGLGGGETQRQGVEALGAWFTAAARDA
ncbi:MAG TPA: hypothetical protein VEW07_10745 [Solirubrobacterales bacterium]|nr:hypothetical protein [Solirubrobacterales bacterium]